MRSAQEQHATYQEITAMTLVDQVCAGGDYIKVASINGIDYYTPNDEDLGDIVAISHPHQLAVYTGFFEMDDMEQLDSGYTQTVHDGRIMCEFEME